MTNKNPVSLVRDDHRNAVIDVGGKPCRGVLEVSFRDSFRLWGKNMSVDLVAVDGGYVIRACFGSNRESGVFIMAEHSQQMRVFKKADSALAVCRRLGLPVVSVQL